MTHEQSFFVVLGDGIGDASRVVGHEMRFAHLDLEVVEADDRVLLRVVLLPPVQLVHARLHYLARALVALAEVREGSLPTFGPNAAG